MGIQPPNIKSSYIQKIIVPSRYKSTTQVRRYLRNTRYFNMAESFVKLLECSICLEQMVVPKILPCGHTFCLDCLCKIEQKEKKIKCPECQKEHDLPIEGAKGFNKNYKLATLIDDLPAVPSAPPLDQHEDTLIDDLLPVPSAPPLDQLEGKIPDRTLQPVLGKKHIFKNKTTFFRPILAGTISRRALLEVVDRNG